MRFREWLTLSESIQIQDGTLGRARETGSEFSYAAGEYWSSFQIRPYSVHRTGFANMNDASANIIAIVKTTPIFPDNGTDRAFIKGLTERLKAAGKQPIPYREGENSWSGAINNLDFDDKERFTKVLQGDNEESTAQTPQMGKAGSNATKVSGVSFSRESGSWAYIFRTPYANNDISLAERIMKEVCRPMVDNDILDFWQLVRGNNYSQAEVMYSSRGRKEQDDETEFERKASGYMKFLAQRMLANHPKAMKEVIQYLKKATPQNTRAPLSDLRKYVQTYHNENSYLNLFLDSLETDDQNKYMALELLADQKDQEKAVWLYKSIADDEYQHIVENPLLYMRDALEIFRMQDVLGRLARENFARFRTQYEASMDDKLTDGGYSETDDEGFRSLKAEKFRAEDFEMLKELSEFIEIGSKEQIRGMHAKMKDRDEQERKQEEEKRRRHNDMMERGRFMYMMAGDTSWKHIPDKYMDGDDVQVGEMSVEEDIVDREDVFHAAHEKASEEAMNDAEERKSTDYGKDEEEVLSDLNYDIDDYVEDRFTDGEFEGLSDEESQRKVKDEYLDDFVRWKKERLEKEEEEESWRYEPEPEQSDIWKYEKEIAEDRAYEEGLVIFKWPDENDEIDVWLHSKHLDKAREMIRRSIRIGMEEKDEYGERKVKRYTKVVFVFHDKRPTERIPAENV